MKPDVAKGRIIELDFVRGIAILGVMGFHFALKDTPRIPGWEWFFTHYGPHGVDLFFVLSGFLVGGLLIKELASGKPRIKNFMIRRAFKIWPQYYFLLFVALFIHPWQAFLVANLVHLQNYLGTTLGQTWSLAVEEHFYLLLPAFLLLIWHPQRAKIRIIYATAVIGILVMAVRTFTVYGLHDPNVALYTHTRIDALFFGVMLAAIYNLDRAAFDRIANRKGLLAAVFVVAVLVKAFTEVDFMNSFGITFMYLGSAALLLLLFAHSGGISKMFWYRAIAWVGLYSYGIFLWHNGVRDPIGRVLGGLPGTWGWGVRELARYVVAIAAGVVTSRLVEWPFLKLREKIFPRVEKAIVVAGPEPRQPVSAAL